jgi:hypothetical protein
MPKPRQNHTFVKRVTEIRANTRTGGKTPQIAKSSPEARKLIKAVLKRCKGNQHEAARRLKLNNQSQLRKMLNGTLRDTPAMRAALKRADARARKAWLMEHRGDPPALDREIAQNTLSRMKRELSFLETLLQVNGKPSEVKRNDPPTNPTVTSD